MRKRQGLFIGLALVCSAFGEVQDYDKVVTKEAKTRAGVFKVHQVADKFYYEIPAAELDRDYLWATRFARATLGVGAGGSPVADRVVRWHLSGTRVTLLNVDYQITADPASPVSAAVMAANNSTIMMSFDVAAFGPDHEPVIEVSKLFTSDVSEFGTKQRLGASYLDAARTWVDRISPFPQNIEAEATQTWVRNDANSPAGQMKPGNATVVVHHSMIKLPENPMRPRLFDDRVGYFPAIQLDYGRDEAKASYVSYICRWRMDKPIVYYIDAATPLKWRKWIKQGVESWRPAMAAAGFPDAIQVKEAPSPKDDPDFSPEDIRYSVIRWMTTPVENAFGPNIHDPRTGEILNADIEFNQNMLRLGRLWYLTQIGPLDARVKSLPLADEIVGEIVQYLIAHEVGHTLGLEHNLKASSMYPADKVHDREWVHKMGFTPSIMDYARFNYVAQPEDGIPVHDLQPRIGPYDEWTIRWGYSPIPEAKTPDEEKPVLRKWAEEQERTPWLRFVTPAAYGAEYGELREAVGDDNAVKSTELGFRNLRRFARMLVPLTTAAPADNYDELVALYNGLIGQWSMELNHVAMLVGGVSAQTRHPEQPGVVFSPVPLQRQREALAFLLENAFRTPDWLLDPDILRRFEPAGSLDRIRNNQVQVLNAVLAPNRFSRMVELQAADPGGAWPVADFVTAVRKGIWSELEDAKVRVDPYRRNLQRAWLEIAAARVSAPLSSGDAKALYLAELKALREAIPVAAMKAADAETRAHLDATLDEIRRLLNPVR